MEFLLTQRRKVFNEITAKNYRRKGAPLREGTVFKYMQKRGENSGDYDFVSYSSRLTTRRKF